MSIQALFQKIDIFSQIFSFQFGKTDRKNRTCLGGVLSAVIIILCSIYLGQLLDLYFGNKLLPKIISTTQAIQFTERQSLNFEKSPVLFFLLFNGYPLEQFEAMTGKKYMNIDIYYTQYYMNMTKQYILPQIDCGLVYPNQTFDGYRCIDFNSIDIDKKSLTFSGDFQTSYEIHFSSCSGEINCAPEQETLQYLTQYNSTLFAHLVTHIQKTTSTIQQGFMLQDSSQKDYISNIHRLDTQYTRNNIKSKINFEGYGFLFIYLDQNYNQIVFQFPMITEVLSQCVCVFNIFFVFGYFASAFSRYQIVEKLSGVYLKEYFKGTAAYLIQKQQNQSPNIDLNRSYAEEIIKIQEQINNTDFQTNLHKVCKINFFQRIRLMILRWIGLDKQNQNEEDIQKSIYEKIIDYTLSQMDIFQVYKQLIHLNMAIKLILTKEQYATLKFCGCNLDESLELLNFDDKINKNNVLQQTQLSQIQQLNYSIKQDINLSNTNQTLSKIKLSYATQKSMINNSPQRVNNTIDIDSQLMLFEKSKDFILTKEQGVDKQNQAQKLENLQKGNLKKKSQLIGSTNQQEVNYDKQIGLDDASPQICKESYTAKNPLILSKLNSMKNKKDKEKQYQQQKDKTYSFSSMNNSIIKSNFLDSQQNNKITKAQGDVETELSETCFQNLTNNLNQKPSNLRLNLPFLENEDFEGHQSYISKQINHIEELNKLDKDEKLQKAELYNFLNKFQNNIKSISYIDKNIFNSLIINYKNSNIL
ncbi:transmembrane protein, putative (macronuclear) [Tetrahymena thermophila SB210]|uniref:Transmembrane protein, putative n=1 Tax=Tetrahymena thermophila (strain SB210) TaxID=312017 RepID=I7LT34_TETTS|nr:transmembrane protein, putative [Tetrahymena thermophila SB210]EAR84163.2 transmembrane protein, putative [Tetrahymena thermophila SB210]|eukprot:XP_001031826.2 transmembrane protein, putative [Tetrahymena thermophila SB210]